MTYAVRGYMARAYLDSSLGGAALGAPPPPTDNIAGTDTLTFSGSATIGTSLRANDTLTFSETATLRGIALLASDMTQEEAYLRFNGSARLSVEVAVVAPPATVSPVKRVSIIMPNPVIDSRGKPT